MKELEEARKTNPTKPEFYNIANSKFTSKCSCFTNKEEGKNKLRQKLIQKENERWKIAQKDEIEKQNFDLEIENLLDEEIIKNPIKIRKEIIANKDKFARMIQKISVIARSQPSHKYCLVAGLRELDNVVAVTVF